MANTTSAKKAARKIARRSIVNRNRIGRVRTFMRKVDIANYAITSPHTVREGI